MAVTVLPTHDKRLCDMSESVRASATSDVTGAHPYLWIMNRATRDLVTTAHAEGIIIVDVTEKFGKAFATFLLVNCLRCGVKMWVVVVCKAAKGWSRSTPCSRCV